MDHLQSRLKTKSEAASSACLRGNFWFSKNEVENFKKIFSDQETNTLVLF